jgi:hypothetical protein
MYYSCKLFARGTLHNCNPPKLITLVYFPPYNLAPTIRVGNNTGFTP